MIYASISVSHESYDVFGVIVAVVVVAIVAMNFFGGRPTRFFVVVGTDMVAAAVKATAGNVFGGRPMRFFVVKAGIVFFGGRPMRFFGVAVAVAFATIGGGSSVTAPNQCAGNCCPSSGYVALLHIRCIVCDDGNATK